MKLDKIKFAMLVALMSDKGATFNFNELADIDALIDINIPEPVQGRANAVDVDELLRQIASPDGFIPAIKAYRVITNAGLKEAKEAVEKYRQPLKKMYDPSDLRKALKDAHYDNDADYHAVERFLNNL